MRTPITTHRSYAACTGDGDTAYTDMDTGTDVGTDSADAYTPHLPVPQGPREYRWVCKACNATGDTTCTLLVPYYVTGRIRAAHARKSPHCRWNEDTVTIQRLKRLSGVGEAK